MREVPYSLAKFRDNSRKRSWGTCSLINTFCVLTYSILPEWTCLLLRIKITFSFFRRPLWSTAPWETKQFYFAYVQIKAQNITLRVCVYGGHGSIRCSGQWGWILGWSDCTRSLEFGEIVNSNGICKEILGTTEWTSRYRYLCDLGIPKQVNLEWKPTIVMTFSTFIVGQDSIFRKFLLDANPISYPYIWMLI